MGQPALDLRRSPQLIRRYGALVGITVAAGLLAGAVTAAYSPALVTSSALILLPQPAQTVQGPAGGANGGADPYTATQEVIAGSNPVLSGALPNVRPAMSLTDLRRDIRIGSPAPDVISISAKGQTARDAEATANAVADSYVQDVRTSTSPGEYAPAQVLQPATSATSPAPLTRLLAGAMLGMVCGVLTGVIAALVSRRPILDPLPDSRASGS
jgi:capsular polysaccharide biosynthesis protein